MDEYLLESIINPDVYFVPGDSLESHYMSAEHFDEILNIPEVADLIAWLYSLE